MNSIKWSQQLIFWSCSIRHIRRPSFPPILHTALQLSKPSRQLLSAHGLYPWMVVLYYINNCKWQAQMKYTRKAILLYQWWRQINIFSFYSILLYPILFYYILYGILYAFPRSSKFKIFSKGTSTYSVTICCAMRMHASADVPFL